ncbi:MAG TPA: hypothetical protein PLO62_14030 [Candidatus Hydrogenedentes bacterium]|nr:hypothetical protein [Candidatus Hydrogenedentota bacterium]
MDFPLDTTLEAPSAREKHPEQAFLGALYPKIEGKSQKAVADADLPEKLAARPPGPLQKIVMRCEYLGSNEKELTLPVQMIIVCSLSVAVFSIVNKPPAQRGA